MRLRVATLIPAALASALFVPGAAATGRTCAPGSPVTIPGLVGSDREGGFVLEPFEVATGVNEISISATQAASFTLPGGQIQNTLDFGLRGPGPDAFRGWNAPQATLSAASATRSYHRGPIGPGTWYVEVGVAAIVPGTTSSYTVALVCRTLDPAPANVPWIPLQDPETVIQPSAGWYQGDLHVHSNDSSDAPAGSSVEAIVAYARSQSLDFLSVTDHNTDGHLDDFGTAQSAAASDGFLLMPGTEVTTYNGHTNWHGGVAEFLEYRTGPVWVRNPDTGELTTLHEARSVNEIFGAARARGSLTQVNHPTQFNDPISANLCRGCAWDYPDTDWSLVDAIEVQTGPPGLKDVPGQTALGPNPFTVTAVRMWEDLLNRGYKVAAVGTSDDHRAGVPGSITQSPIGQPTTVVYANELSEQAILDGIRARHAFVKFWGPSGPHIDFFSTDGAAMMGDVIHDDTATLHAHVWQGFGHTLRVVFNGVVVFSVPITQNAFNFTFPAVGPGWWRVETVLGGSYQAMTNPIFLEP